MGAKLKFPLAVLITGEDVGLDKALGKVNLKLRATGQLATSVGRGLTFGLSAPLALVGLSALRVGTAVETSLLQVRAAANLTVEQTKRLHLAAREYGDMGVGVREATEGMIAFAKAGLGVDEILAIQRPTILLAKSALLEMADVSDGLVNIITGYRLPFTDAARVTDQLVYASDSYTVSVLDLFEAFKLAGPVAAALNQEYETTLTLLSMLGQAGFKGQIGGTSLRDLMADLSEFSRGHASSNQAGVLTRLGIRPEDLRTSTGELRSMFELLELIESRADKTTLGGDLMTLFGKRGGPGAAALLGQTTQAMRKFREELSTTAGTAQSKYDIVMSGAAGTTARFQAQVQNLQDSLANSGLIDAFTRVTVAAGEWLKRFDALSPARKRFIVNAGLIAVGVGPIVYAVGKAITLITELRAALLTLKAAELAMAGSDAAAAAAGAGGAAAAGGGGVGRLLAGSSVAGPFAAAGAVALGVRRERAVDDALIAEMREANSRITDEQREEMRWADRVMAEHNSKKGWFARTFGGFAFTEQQVRDATAERRAVLEAARAAEGRGPSKVYVEFKNVPPGTSIKTDDKSGVALDVGYAMPGVGG